MDSKTVKAIAGLVLAPLACEVVPHHRDAECVDLNIDIVCDPGEQYFIVPQGVHVPHTEPEMPVASHFQLLFSGVVNSSSSDDTTALNRHWMRWLAKRSEP